MCRNRVSVTAATAAGLLAVLLLCVLLTGCPSLTEKKRVENIGALIMNYPDWARNDVGMNLYDAAFSQWSQWQSDTNAPLRSIVPQHLSIPDSTGKYVPIREYTGNYRLYVTVMNIILEFDNGKCCLLLHLWNKIIDDNSFITIPQQNQKAFSYNPIAKHGYEGEIIGEAQCNLQLIKTENHIDYFTYRLTINNTDIINQQLYAPQIGYYPQSTVYNWLPALVYQDTSMRQIKYRQVKLSDNSKLIGYINKDRSIIANSFPKTILLDRGEIDVPNILQGMKEISVDEANQKAVYRLFDGAPDAPQYVELHRDTENTVTFTWFNLPEGQEDSAANRIDPHKETLYVYKYQ